MRFLFLLFFFTGCLLTHQDVYDELETEEKNRKAEKEAALKKPSWPVKMSEMEESLRQMRGKVESLESSSQERAKAYKTLEENFNNLQNRLDEEVKQLKQKLTAQSADPDNIFKTAEELFQKKAWKKAIVEYEKYREKSKKGRFYGRATFQIGMCFKKLNMKKESDVFFKETLSAFPNSPEGKQAKILLKPAARSSQ